MPVAMKSRSATDAIDGREIKILPIRHGDEQPTPRYSVKLFEHLWICLVRDVLQNIGREHQIERCVRERQCGEVSDLKRMANVTQRSRGNVAAHNDAIVRQVIC